jgi:serine/threonine-protein kinase
LDSGENPSSIAAEETNSAPSSSSAASLETNLTSPRDRQLPLTETLSILLQILAALNKSANRGIVHRDIKPENIMLTADGEVKVADFGLARLLLGDDPQLTRAGTTLGTPMYMSPEQIQEGQVDIRSDLYSLGATIYHMLAGSPPYTGETPLALAMKHVQAPVPDIALVREDLPESIQRLLSRLLAKSPEDRFEHPSEVLAFLRQHRSGDLAEYWPEHTVPLPGATARHPAGPMQATLFLQSKLRQAKRRRQRQWLVNLGFIGLLTAAFTIGCAATFDGPFDLYKTSSSEVFNGIEMQPSAQQQYVMALLQRDLHPIYKWEAVSHYFKPEGKKSATNRLFAGLASLQWGAALQFREEYAEAERILQKTASDPEMEQLYRALAYLQIAEGAYFHDFEGREQDIARNVDQAIEFASSLGAADRRLLEQRVQQMHAEIQRRWFTPPAENSELQRKPGT